MAAGHAQDDVESEATSGVVLREVVEEMDFMGCLSLESVIHYIPNLRHALPCSKDRMQWMRVAYGGDHITEETGPQLVACRWANGC